MTDDLDLFGLPVDPRHGLAGRPRHIPMPRLRAEVAALHEAGHSHEAIAAAIGITAPTLRLNYPDELKSLSQAPRRRRERDAQAQS